MRANSAFNLGESQREREFAATVFLEEIAVGDLPLRNEVKERIRMILERLALTPKDEGVFAAIEVLDGCE